MSKPKKSRKPGKPTPAVPEKGNPLLNWFEKKFNVLSLVVILLAVALRLSLLLELPRMPFNELHRGTEFDMNFFDVWGDRIAGGDILTDTLWHPYHFWHSEIAKSFGLQTAEQGKAKWNEWYGGKQYHQEPLYPLIIGLCKMTGPHGRFLVYILQMLAGILSIWMIMWLGRHYFGAAAGILGGLLFTLYAPNLLLDAVLLRTSFNTTLLLGMLFIAEKLMTGKSKPWHMGLIGGAGYLLFTTSMLLWIPLVVRWLYKRRQDLKASWQVALAFGVVLSFLVVRNSITGSPLLSTSSVGPITYVLSNFPKYQPHYGFAYFQQAGEVMNRTGGRMIPAALEVISVHPSLWDWVKLQFAKLGAVFHWYEIPNNINTYLAQSMSPTLKAAFIPYSVIAALGLAGLLLGIRRTRSLNLLMGVLSQVAMMVIFYVLCRFRIPLVAMLAIYAGYAMQLILDFRKWKTMLLAAGISLAAFFLIIRPTPEIAVKFLKGDLTAYFQLYYLPRLEKGIAEGDYKGCTQLLEEFVKTIPPDIDRIRSNAELKHEKARELADYYGALYYDLAGLYQSAGDKVNADKHFAKSAKLKK